MEVDEVVRTIVAESPTFHHDPDGGRDVSWAAGPELLAFLAERTGPGDTTLETGAGSSTAVVVAAGADHHAVSPVASEERRIRAWLADHGVDAAGYTHLLGRSEDVLPTLDGPWDLVLVDGRHAFPLPGLDWFYGARRLRAGGLVVVDDLQLWPCRIVAEFLDDAEGWPTAGRGPRWRAWRAERPGAELTARWWGQQAHVLRMGEGSDRPLARLRRALPPRVRRLLGRLRRRLT